MSPKRIEAHQTEEFKYRFAQEVRRIRTENGYETIYDLANASNIQPLELMVLELGKFKDLSLVFRLARFYKKRVKLEFF